MVSLYMKTRAKQLSILANTHMKKEDAAKLCDLISIERSLIIIRSLIIKHQGFFHQLFDDKIITKNPWENSHATKILLATIDLCSASYFSQFTLNKLFKQWEMIEPPKNLYLRFLIQFKSLVNGLPMAVFENDASKLLKFAEVIVKMMEEKSKDADTKNFRKSGSGLLRSPTDTSKLGRRYI